MTYAKFEKACQKRYHYKFIFAFAETSLRYVNITLCSIREFLMKSNAGWFTRNNKQHCTIISYLKLIADRSLFSRTNIET
jgi:hypothetical protein